MLIRWRGVADEAEEEDDEDDEAPMGSLQRILDNLEEERKKAVHEALNPPLVPGQFRGMIVSEARKRIEDASKPYKEKMEQEKQKWVKDGRMTEEQADAVVGMDKETKKQKRKAKKDLQRALNHVQKEMNIAVRAAVSGNGKVAEAAKPFGERMEEVKKRFQEYRGLTEAETDAIGPVVEEEVEDTPEQVAAKEAAVPRVVTDRGWPVTRVC